MPLSEEGATAALNRLESGRNIRTEWTYIQQWKGNDPITPSTARDYLRRGLERAVADPTLNPPFPNRNSYMINFDFSREEAEKVLNSIREGRPTSYAGYKV